MSQPRSLRKKVYNTLNPHDNFSGRGGWIDSFLIVLIALNVLAVCLETEPSIEQKYSVFFYRFDVFSVIVFSIEYVMRVWCSVENPELKGKTRPRLRYMMTPMAIIDLLAVLPFYLSLFFTLDLRILRAFRLLRVFKLTRYSSAMSMLLEVFKEEAGVLFAAFFLLFVLLILAASGAYLFEHQVQPEKFGSIIEATWWAVVTLTTVGYGDATPITVGGRLFGGLVTIIGVGMAALPAGILATGFANNIQQRRDGLRREFRAALADGVVDEEEEAQLEALRIKLGITKRTSKRLLEEIHHQREAPSLQSTCTCPNCGHQFKP